MNEGKEDEVPDATSLAMPDGVFLLLFLDASATGVPVLPLLETSKHVDLGAVVGLK